MSPMASSIRNKILNTAYNILPNMAFIYLLHLLLPTGYLRLCHSKCYASWKSLVVKHLFLCFIHRICLLFRLLISYHTFLKFYVFFKITAKFQNLQTAPLSSPQNKQSLSLCAYNSLFSMFIAMIIF